MPRKKETLVFVGGERFPNNPPKRMFGPRRTMSGYVLRLAARRTQQLMTLFNHFYLEDRRASSVCQPRTMRGSSSIPWQYDVLVKLAEQQTHDLVPRSLRTRRIQMIIAVREEKVRGAMRLSMSVAFLSEYSVRVSKMC